MAAFDPCASCRCHIKRSDRHCPFCGAENSLHDAIAVVPPVRGRVSRAGLFALGTALTAAACTTTASAPSPDAAVTKDAGPADAVASHDVDSPDARIADATSIDSAIEAAAPGADSGALDSGHPADAATDGGAACPTTGTFSCEGFSTCQTATEVCVVESPPSCLPFSQLIGDASCGPCPSCACIYGSGHGGGCQELDGGGILYNSNACYGAPAPRVGQVAA